MLQLRVAVCRVESRPQPHGRQVRPQDRLSITHHPYEYAKYSDLDLDNVKFGRLEQMITNLPEFEDIDDLASPAIEEVLQEILESWLEYRHNQ